MTKSRSLEQFQNEFDPLVRSQQEVARLSKQLSDLEERLKNDRALARLYDEMHNRPAAPPKWLVVPPKKGKKPPVIATAFLSDCHFDEVVDPAQINYVNQYNREIAEQRLKRFFEKTLLLCDRYLAFDVQGIVLPLGGDMVSGNIHEELAQTNHGYILETCLHWTDQLDAGIQMLAEHFPTVHVPCVPGNHGRMTRKPRAKGRVQDNFDWLIYKMLEKRAPKNVTFQVGVDADTRWKVYQHRYQLTHGDQFRGGSGWGGVASPILRGDQKKREREVAVNNPYDTLIMGHFHQFLDLGVAFINGSLKGYDEYASLENFRFEVPKQGFWLTDPGYGRIMTCPIFVADNESYFPVEECA
jgi:hypothetical protein